MIHPRNGHVLLQLPEIAGKTAGGILLPGGAQEAPTRGTVVAVGEARIVDGQVMGHAANQGDTVIFARMGLEVEDEGETYMLIHEDSILAVVS